MENPFLSDPPPRPRLSADQEKLLSWLRGLADQHLEALVTATGFRAGLLVGLVKASETWTRLRADPVLRQVAAQEIAAIYGRRAVDRLLEKLGEAASRW